MPMPRSRRGSGSGRVRLALLCGLCRPATTSSAAARSAAAMATAMATAPPTPAVRPDTADYRTLLLQGAPLLDVRSPVEFARGSLPSATNLPLLNDAERHLVGKCYRERGEVAAIELGNELVRDRAREERVVGWTGFCRDHPTGGYLCCHRGGLRSRTAQDWIEGEIGVRYPLVEGGYKALRRFLIDELTRALDPAAADLVVVGGRTGSGKTRAIEALGGEWEGKGGVGCSVDLEGLARHRGSTFGRIPEDPDQPSQVAFENGVAIAFLRVLDGYPSSPAGAGGGGKIAATAGGGRAAAPPPRGRVYVEDEGGRIGKIGLPPLLRNRMKAADGLAVIEEGLEERLDVLVEDYVTGLGGRFVEVMGEERGREEHPRFLREGLDRLRKKLGGPRHAELARTMEAAFAEQANGGDCSLHRVWLAGLLNDYYDPMYDYQIAQRDDEVLFRGEREAVVEWAKAAAAASRERMG